MRALLLTTALGSCLALAGAALAQNQTPPASKDQPSSQVGGQRPVQGGATAATQDRTFAETVAVANKFEVEAAGVAQQNSKQPTVQQFAQQMITDHTAAGQQLETLASGNSIQLPQQLDKSHADKLAELRSKSGTDFDRDYAATMVEGHKKVVSLFEEEANHGRQPDILQFARNTLPTIQHHLEMAESMQAQVGRQASQ